MAVIEDGTGTGIQAKIDSDNRLLTESVSKSIEHYHNVTKGTGFHILCQQTPTGAGDCFFYMKNLSTKNWIIEGFNNRVASAETIEVNILQTGTPSGGSTITPVNVNSTSSLLLNGTFEGGNDITGMSGGRLIDRAYLTNTDTGGYNFELDVVIGPGHTLTLYAVTGGIQVDVMLQLYEKV